MNSWITNWNKIKIKVKQIIKKQPGKDAESQWTKCSCQEIIYKEDLQKNLHVCPKCEMHHKVSCRDRFNITFDEKIYTILSTPQPPDDPLKFVDQRKYTERLQEARKLTNQDDAIMIASLHSSVIARIDSRSSTSVSPAMKNTSLSLDLLSIIFFNTLPCFST